MMCDPGISFRCSCIVSASLRADETSMAHTRNSYKQTTVPNQNAVTPHQQDTRPPFPSIPPKRNPFRIFSMPSVFIKRMGHSHFEKERFSELEFEVSDSVSRLARRVCTTLTWQAHENQVDLFLVSKDRAKSILRGEVFDPATEIPLYSVDSLAEAQVTHDSCSSRSYRPPPPPQVSSNRPHPVPLPRFCTTVAPSSEFQTV